MALVFNMVGGSVSSSATIEKDVNFYDYDGTLVASYTSAEAQALSALPDAPDHSTDAIPLTFQSWNHTLEQVNAVVYKLNIGATYIPTDGKTHMILWLNAATGYDVPIWFNKTDGSTLTLTLKNSAGDTVWSTTSTASALTLVTVSGVSVAGTYDLQWEITSGTGKYGFGSGNTGYTCIGGTTIQYRYALIALYVGSGAQFIGNYSFFDCKCLSQALFPNNITIVANYALSGCLSLPVAIIPCNATMILTNAFNACTIRVLSIPCKVTTLNGYAFGNCSALKTIIIPNSVTSYSSAIFINNFGVTLYDFTSYKSVPSLPDAAFGGISSACRMKIPSALYNAWKTAANWSAYAGYMDAY